MALDYSKDDVRRQVYEVEKAQDAVMEDQYALVTRLYEDPDITEEQRDDVLLGGMRKRTWVKVGGVAVLASAVLAACGSDKSSTAAGDSSTTAAGGATTVAGGASTTVAAGGTSMDLVLARTAASLEGTAIDAYTKGAGLIKDPTALKVATLFLNQHMEHQKALNALITKSGGQAYTMPNPALKPTIDGQIAGLKTETDVLKFAYALEVIAAQTYQSTVTGFTDKTLNKTVMSIGGVEARHAAILATVLKMPAVPAAFQGQDKAITAASFVK